MKELQMSDVNVLWHEGFYDRMLSGFLEYKEQIYFFNCVNEEMIKVDEDDFVSKRIFELYELTAEELSKKLLSHIDFQRFVGTHSDYDENRNRNHGVKSQEKWDLYYKNTERREKLKVDFSDKKPKFILKW